MPKYKLKSRSVQIGGRIHLKREKTIIDTDDHFKIVKTEVEAAEKAGYLERVDKVDEVTEELNEIELMKKNKSDLLEILGTSEVITEANTKKEIVAEILKAKAE